MVNEFSSLIEFFAAIYVTMTLDSSFFQSFWSPNYYKDIDLELRKCHFDDNVQFYEFFTKKIKNIYNNLKDGSRKRGFYMLVVCVCLLILCGFSLSSNGLVSLFLTLIAAFVIYVLNGLLFTKWKSVVCMLLILLLCFFLLVYCNIIYSQNPIISFIYSFLDILMPSFLILLIIYPVLHQLFLNWLYSSVFKGFIKSRIKHEYTVYVNAVNDYNIGNKENIPDDYQQALFSKFVKIKNEDLTSDVLLQDFDNVLFERLYSAVNPSPLKLVISLLHHRFDKLKGKFPMFKKSDDLVSSYSRIDYNQEYQKYCECYNEENITLRTYCKLKGLDLANMIREGKKMKNGR